MLSSLVHILSTVLLCESRICASLESVIASVLLGFGFLNLGYRFIKG